MGEIVVKFFVIFELMKEICGVYLFDEFDVIGVMCVG